MTGTLKRILLLLAIPLLFFSSNSLVFAEDKDFNISALATYAATNSDMVRVTQDITLKNNKEFVYAPTYSITLRLKHISDVLVSNTKGAIPFTLKELPDNSKVIQVNFPEKVVGINKVNSFSLSFITSDYIQKSGGIHTISIPATSNISDFDSYIVEVKTPANFGNPSIVKPNAPYDAIDNTYTFTKANLKESGIYIVFGKKQYYFFKLSYNLENKNVFPVKTEIALPANTSYQDVIIQNINPQPESVHKDQDGNYMATYMLPAKTGFSVKAHILIESSFTPRKEDISVSQRNYYTRPQKYWESNSDIIKKAAVDLNSAEEIYNYVIKTLSYNNSKTAEKNERLGASSVLSKPYFAVCLEFTDLFIALARSKGIPARAVEGYAVTQDDPTRPTSLFEDVLHAWPEYYDDSRKAWIMIDPTWGDTTKGVDYFHTFDFDHVAFVTNGLSSNYPIPAGGYKINSNSKDVVMTYADASEFIKTSKLNLKTLFSPFLENNRIKGTLTIGNKGNTQDSPKTIHIYVDSKKSLSINFPPAPPLGESSMVVSIPIPEYSIFNSLTNIAHMVTIQDDNGKILSKTTVNVFPLSVSLMLGGAVFIGFIIIFTIAFKTRSLPFQK